ncbi:MAG: phenol hydroxylase [Rhodocyclaceae bacterium]|nr:MAG: phenol hydroxylase [Rhodocyclaceae bacterium]
MTEDQNTGFSLDKRYVRILGRTSTGHIEFSFAVGEPELMVELVLPEAAFKEFCEANRVIMLGDEAPKGEGDAREWDWSLRDATKQRFK